MNKNKLCINCNTFLVYSEANFSDYGDLCVHCFYELKIANFRRELVRNSDSAIAALDRASVGLKRSTKIIKVQQKEISNLREDLHNSDVAYSELASEFLEYMKLLGDQKPTKGGWFSMVKVQKRINESNELLIKRFISKVMASGIIEEAKRRQFFLKPNAARRLKKKLGIESLKRFYQHGR